MMTSQEILTLIKQETPSPNADGLLIGDMNDNTTWTLSFNDQALQPEIDAANAFMLTIDPFSYEAAKLDAKRELGEYYVAYSRSQFVAGPDTFPANDPSAFLVISEVLRLDPSNSSQVVFDIEGDPHPVANAAAWANFWDQYVGLFDTARGIVGTAWQDVKTATTPAEVQVVLDGLPPIPGS